MWFKNKRDEGIAYPDLFNPISVYSIALILTAVSVLWTTPIILLPVLIQVFFKKVECNIDEWITGIKTDIIFYADEYRTIYESHVNSLLAFGAYSKAKGLDLLGRVQRRLYNFGR
jgi:hypothetical protein